MSSLSALTKANLLVLGAAGPSHDRPCRRSSRPATCPARRASSARSALPSSAGSTWLALQRSPLAPEVSAIVGSAHVRRAHRRPPPAVLVDLGLRPLLGLRRGLPQLALADRAPRFVASTSRRSACATSATGTSSRTTATSQSWGPDRAASSRDRPPAGHRPRRVSRRGARARLADGLVADPRRAATPPADPALLRRRLLLRRRHARRPGGASIPGCATKRSSSPRLLDAGVPTMGVCLGSQLLAEAAGARGGARARAGDRLVRHGARRQRARATPSWAGSTRRFEAFQWHSYRSPAAARRGRARHEPHRDAGLPDRRRGLGHPVPRRGRRGRRRELGRELRGRRGRGRDRYRPRRR